MLSLIGGVLCTIIGFGLILFGLATLIIGAVTSSFKAKISAPTAGAGIGLASLFSYKKGYKDGMNNAIK